MSVGCGFYSLSEPERLVALDVAPRMAVTVKHDFLTGQNRDNESWWATLSTAAALPGILLSTTFFKLQMLIPG